MSELILNGEPGSADHPHQWRCAVCHCDLQVEDGRPVLDRLLTDMRAAAIAEPFMLEAARVMHEARVLISSPDGDVKDAADVLWVGEQHLRHTLLLDEESSDGD